MIKCTLILQQMPPTKFGRAKNVQNSARFLTTFEFDCEYLWKGSTYRKSEKFLVNYISSPGRNKIGELEFFRETIFRPLGGAGPSNFYTPYNP